MKKNILMVCAVVFGCIGLFSCNEDDKTTPESKPQATVTTGEASYITQIAAILNGESDASTLADIDEQGFIYSTSSAPSYDKDKKLLMVPSYGQGPGMGPQQGQQGHYQTDPTYKAQFGERLRCLSPATTYYFCAFVKLKSTGKVEMGEVKSFSTPAAVAPQAVDLGLSVKWANCNVGANNPWETGGYYAWGELTEKETYFRYQYEGQSIGNDIAGTQYDVARAILGEGWSMPTKAQIDEILNNCTWTWIDDYEGKGVAGHVVASKTNSNSIFIPAAGYINNDALTDFNAAGRYWASTIFDNHLDDSGADVIFTSAYIPPYANGSQRGGGSNVRAVCR